MRGVQEIVFHGGKNFFGKNCRGRGVFYMERLMPDPCQVRNGEGEFLKNDFSSNQNNVNQNIFPNMMGYSFED